MEGFRTDQATWEKSPGQIVTEADLAVDRLLRERLLGAYPEDGWLSEETTDSPDRLTRSRVWIVDPIDGTRAYAKGRAEFTVSAALCLDGAPALGMVYNPATEELFEAVRGGGAWQGERRLAPSRQSEVTDARLVVSSGEATRTAWQRYFAEAERIAVGSLAYKLALVAAGRFDGYISLRNSFEWDIAAGWLILHEAGARLTDAHGAAMLFNAAEPTYRGVAAANPALHGALIARLRAALAEA